MRIARTMLATTTLAAVVIVALTNAASVAVPYHQPHLIGGEVFVYQMDTRDHDVPARNQTRDASGNGNHATLHEVVHVEGKHGEAYDCSVPGDYIVTPNAVSSNRPQGTFMAWVLLESGAGGGKLFVKNDPGITTELGLLIENQRVKFNTDQTNASPELFSASTITYGAWTHIAVSWSETGKRIYLNSILDASDTDPSGTGGDATHAYICNDPNLPSDRGFDGRVDEVRLYDRELDGFEIYSVMSGPYRYTV